MANKLVALVTAAALFFGGGSAHSDECDDPAELRCCA